MIHQLKCEAKYFNDLVNGRKTFEVRKNDRDFHVGDYLGINELTKHPCNAEKEHKPTGRCAIFRISYILDDPKYMKDGFVVLGIVPCELLIGQAGCEAHVLMEGGADHE